MNSTGCAETAMQKQNPYTAARWICRKNDLKPRSGIVQNLVFCALVTGFGTIVYFTINSFL